ncbi:MAG TPA: BON domain-containing protein [Mycobacteriales bacterium]|nr:BON domain-containing protein [Mycobacteriales bacterium]
MGEQPVVYTEARIQQRLAEDPRVAALGLRVTVRPPKIFLRGEVPSRQRRDRAAEMVRELMPGYEVYNEIEVTGAGEPDSREEFS